MDSSLVSDIEDNEVIDYELGINEEDISEGESYQKITRDLLTSNSLFIIIYEGGEFFGPIIVGLSMNKFGNPGFIYSILFITIISLILGIIRTIFKNNENKNY